MDERHFSWPRQPGRGFMLSLMVNAVVARLQAAVTLSNHT